MTVTRTQSSSAKQQQQQQHRRAMFLSLLLCYCCHGYSVYALQVRTTHHRIHTNPAARAGSKRRRPQTALSASVSREDESSSSSLFSFFSNEPGTMDRRQVFSKALFAGLATPFLLQADPANALLLRFPVDDPQTQPLKNKYHFIRAGTSELEMEGIYSTNPLFLTNRDNAMAPEGYEDLKGAVQQLKTAKLPPTVVYHSLAANGMDTGDYLARELRLGRDRLLPEFTYLDQRGIGLWDSSDANVVRSAVWAMDQAEAGEEGRGGRPPANTDGTPNDTLHDQFIRLRQFLSLQESRTAGDIILIIFPDGTGPALLSCMIAGIPFSEAHALEFQPGELRMDITPESVKALYETRKTDPSYLASIEEGQKNLAELRQMKAKDFSVSYKDSQANEQQLEDNKDYYEKQQEEAAAKLKAEEERQAAMQEQLRISRERAKAKEEQRKAELAAAQEKKAETIRLAKEQAEQRKAEQKAAYIAKQQRLQAEADARANGQIIDSSQDSTGVSPLVLGAGAVGLLGAVAAMAMGGGSDDDDNAQPTAGDAVLAKTKDPTDDEDATAAVELDTNDLDATVASAENDDSRGTLSVDAETIAAEDVEETEEITNDANNEEDEPDRETLEGGIPEPPTTGDPEEEFANKLQAAERDLKDAFVEAADVQKRKQQQEETMQPPQKSSLFANDPPVTITTTTTTTASTSSSGSTNFVYEDDQDDSNWLKVLGEIREEVQDEEEDDFGMVDYAALVAETDDDAPLY